MIAMNEEANLPRTLESVRWADEIVVVDSGSKDRTLEIAQSFGAKTSYHAFGGHGEQKNVALDLCTSDWILLLDADEVLTPELQDEIRQLLACDGEREPQYGAYWIPRLNLIFGRWMRHGGFYPDRKLRLFRRGAARLSEGVGPHSTPQFSGPRGKLKHDMLHYAYPNMKVYLEHMNRYSSEIAQLLDNKGRTASPCPSFSGTRWPIPPPLLSITTSSAWDFWMAARAFCCTSITRSISTGNSSKHGGWRREKSNGAHPGAKGSSQRHGAKLRITKRLDARYGRGRRLPRSRFSSLQKARCRVAFFSRKCHSAGFQNGNC